MIDKDGLLKKCEEFKARNDREGFLQFYYNEVFPAVVEDFRERFASSEGGFSCDALILTAGMTAEPMVLSISALKPKEAFFLATGESKRTVENVIRWCGMAAGRTHVREVLSNDTRQVYEKVKEICDGRDLRKVAVDITGGTKAMVGGCAAAAALLRLTIIYVDSRFSWFAGKSEPFSERLVVLPNPYEVFGDEEANIGFELFNKYLFGPAREVFERLANTTVREFEYRVFANLCEAYELWDRFDYSNAFRALRRAMDKLSLDRPGDDPLLEGIGRNLEVLKVLSRNDPGKNVFQLFQDAGLVEALVLDLYSNGLRRRDQGRYDDGIIRLYRVIELMGQARLIERFGIDPGNVAIEDSGTADRFSDICGVIYGRRRELPVKAGLMDCWTLLVALGDDHAGIKSVDDLRKLMDVVQSRNLTMIEHSNQSRKKEDFSKFESYVKGILEKTFAEIDDRLSAYRFPHYDRRKGLIF